MATGERIDPYQNFRFRVEIDGIQTAAFSKVTVPDSSTDIIEYREGTDSVTPRKLSGVTKYGNVTLEKGLSDSMDLYNWRKQVEETGAVSARKDLSIILIDEEGNDASRWDLFQCWPIKYDAADLDAKGNDVSIETLEIAHEGITRVS